MLLLNPGDIGTGEKIKWDSIKLSLLNRPNSLNNNGVVSLAALEIAAELTIEIVLLPDNVITTELPSV